MIIMFNDYFTALLRFKKFFIQNCSHLHIIFIILSCDEDCKDERFLSSLVICLCLLSFGKYLSLAAEEIKMESFLISLNSAYISDGFQTEIL